MSRWCPILVVMTYTKTLLSPGAFQWTCNSHTTLDVEGNSTHCRQDILWSTICILETNFIMKVWKGKRKGKKTMFVWTKFDKIQESLTWMSKLSNYWKYCLFFINLDSGMERLLIACEMVYAFIHIFKICICPSQIPSSRGNQSSSLDNECLSQWTWMPLLKRLAWGIAPTTKDSWSLQLATKKKCFLLHLFTTFHELWKTL